MHALTVDLSTSADLLNVSTQALREALKANQLRGVPIGDDWRVSVFELSRVLGASPDQLLEYLEDFLLAERMREVEGEETFDPEAGRAIYERELEARHG
jgi:hypothetical protein